VKWVTGLGVKEECGIGFDSVEKWYGATHALRGVSITCRPGEIHAIVGENGSGKSTLLKIASGEIRPDKGRLIVEGKERRFRQPADALKSGVALIAQEVPLCPSLTVAENVAMGVLSGARVLSVGRCYVARVREILQRLGEDIDPRRAVASLRPDERQVVAIARALYRSNCSVILFDEPTSSLSLSQAERLFDVIRKLKDSGVTVVYVTQRLGELSGLVDRISVIRDGTLVGAFEGGDVPEHELVELMVGRKLITGFKAEASESASSQDALLSVEELRVLPAVRGVSFKVFKGEVVGVTGLAGSGASELLEALAGRSGKSVVGGVVLVSGRRALLSSPRKVFDAGLGYVPPDRRKDALVPAMSVAENIQLADFGALWPPFVSRRRRRDAKSLAELFSLKAPSLDAPASSLSGGNQQKLVLARVLAKDPKVILLNEPTRGVDVGAKLDIFNEIRQVAKRGKGVVMYSSEVKDLMEWCDRVLVFYRGVIVADLPVRQAKESEVVALSSGANPYDKAGDLVVVT
jgi:ribose transport system ATP-binding protein